MQVDGHRDGEGHALVRLATATIGIFAEAQTTVELKRCDFPIDHNSFDFG